jgi:hypothetical protein
MPVWRRKEGKKGIPITRFKDGRGKLVISAETLRRT